jgi:hypothetical protein
MAKAFKERPRWQRWSIVGGWLFLGLVAISIINPPDKQERAAPVAGSAAVKADLAGYQKAFTRIALPCEAATLQVGNGLQNLRSGDRLALAQAVQAMADGCNSAWLGISDLERPEGLTDAQDAAADKIEKDCGFAFYLRKELAGTLVPVVDGDMRPSLIAGIQSDMAEMKAAVAACSRALDALAPKPAPSPSAK